MDIKDLNKSQLILLAILLSFIVSIATGIVTVSLIQQAPPSITTPINRVIKQTVEKIVQLPGNTTVKTILIKEEDLVVDAIEKNKRNLFSITKEVAKEVKDEVKEEGEGEKESEKINLKTTEIPAGFGFFINSDGNRILVADGLLVDEKANYFIKNSEINNGEKLKANFIFKTEDGFSFLELVGALEGKKAKMTLPIPTFGDFDKMKIGQKILTFGNNISSLVFNGSKKLQENLKINQTREDDGGLILNLDGEVLGIILSDKKNSLAPINLILKSFKDYTLNLQPTSPKRIETN
ncbi:MAG: hypothetical protein AAB693_00160 [Patescibacteria group bacterium]